MVKLLKDQSICINIISRHKKKKNPRHTTDAPLSALKLSRVSNLQCYWAGHAQHTHVIWTCTMVLGKGQTSVWVECQKWEELHTPLLTFVPHIYNLHATHTIECRSSEY